MSVTVPHFRLSHLPTSARLALVSFVLLIGIGYLSALAHMFFTYAATDGKPGLSPDDVRLQIAGKREKTLIEAKLDGGSMAQYLDDPAKKAQIFTWVHAGAKEADFGKVQPIFQENCVACHNANGAAKFRPLTDFKGVAAVAQQDRGETPAAWARVAHIHLQSLATIYILLGLAFAFCSLPEWFKSVMTPLPFVAILGDFGIRAFVPAYPDLVYAVMASGALGGLCTGIMILSILWECTIVPRKRKPFVATGDLAFGAAS